MAGEKKGKVIEAVTNIIGNSAGEVVGSGVGVAIAGPGGAVLGGAIGGAIQSVFSWAGNEIQERFLSKQEKKRVSQVFDLAQKKIIENKYAGKQFRESVFFETHEASRSTAEELLEGVLLTAQREYEERKIPYIANLYANICFDPEISLPVANSLIKFSGELSYQELSILHCISILQTVPTIKRRDEYQSVQGLDNVNIATSTFKLYREGLIHTTNSNVILSAGGINPKTLKIEGIGRFLYTRMELVYMPHDEMMHKIFNFFSDEKLPEVIP